MTSVICPFKFDVRVYGEILFVTDRSLKQNVATQDL